ncbi:MAG: ImmA/IrrE family metallo-endopeptidase [Proteobacteria bacterium]|nr:ImmA/IrrE family metallo-endopeptidase [Pseudomonadota bacterium]
MLNIEFLQSKIDQKFSGKVIDFAKAVGVSKQAAYDWLNQKSSIEERRVFDIAFALDLDEAETEALIGVPQTVLCFRKKGMDSADPVVRENSVNLANTFFKIDASSYILKDSFTLDVRASELGTIAKLIRQNLQIDANIPLTFKLLLSELNRHNICVFFIPFSRLGLSLSKSSNREVAFTARKGDRMLVFVDTERTKDEAVFDICHELTHILLGHVDPSEDDERLCNNSAQELVYPKKFFEAHPNELEVFSNATKHSWARVYEKFAQLSRDFDWSPKGLALALRDYGFIGKSSHEFRRLLTLEKTFAKGRKTVDELFFQRFDPSALDTLEAFFSDDIQKDPDIFRPMIELKDAAAFGHLSSRKLAEILTIEAGDADEIVRSWRSMHDESQDDLNDPKTEE